MTRQPHFDIDRQYGEAGEEVVRTLFGLAAHLVEVKRPRFDSRNVFIEVSHRPRGMDRYIPSGLSVTHATYWAFVFGNAVYLYPTSVLKEAVARQEQEPIDAGLRGDNPTKGYVVSTQWLSQLAQAEAP